MVDNNNNETAENPDRRQFLNRIWAFFGLISVAEFGWLGLSFMNSRKERNRPVKTESIVSAGAVEQFTPGTVTAVPLGQFYLACLGDGSFLAMSRTCTHLGCSVPWDEEKNQFVCPCHGSKYRLDGRRIEDPAPRNLDRFKLAALDDPQTRRQFQVYIDQFDQKRQASRKELAERQRILAPLQLQAGQEALAPEIKQALLEQILETDAGNGNVLVELVFFYATNEQWDRALESARRYLTIDGRENAGRLRIGLLAAEILANMGRRQEAIAELENYLTRTEDRWYRLVADCLLDPQKENVLAEKAGESPEYLLTGHVALAHVDVASTRGADCSACILVEGEACVYLLDGVAAHRLGQVGRDKCHRCSWENRLVGCDRAKFRHRLIETTDRRAAFVSEKYESRVPPDVCLDLLVEPAEIIDHSSETDFVTGDFAVLDHLLGDASIFVPVVCGIAYGGDVPVGQPDFGRALDVCDICFEGIAQVYQFFAL